MRPGLELYGAADAAYVAAEQEFLAPLSTPAAERFRSSLQALLDPSH